MSEVELSPTDVEKIKQLIVDDHGDDLVDCVQEIFVDSVSLSNKLTIAKIDGVSILSFLAESPRPSCFFKIWKIILDKSDDGAKARFPVDLFTHIVARATQEPTTLRSELRDLLALYFASADDPDDFMKMRSGFVGRAQQALAPYIERSEQLAKVFAERDAFDAVIEQVVSEARSDAKVRNSRL